MNRRKKASSKTFFVDDLFLSKIFKKQYFKKPRFIRNIYEMYTCADCSKSYKSKIYLKQHVSYYCEKLPKIPCPYCHYSSKVVARIEHHIFFKHRKKNQPLNTPRLADSRKFPFIRNSYERYTCAHCLKSFKFKSCLKTHLGNVCNMEPKFLCPYCDYGAMVAASVRYHITHTHAKKKLPVISSRLAHSDKFPRQPFRRNMYEQYTCAHCNKSYKCKHYLKLHLSNFCQGLPIIACPYCNYRSKIVAKVNKHICYVHPEKNQPASNSRLPYSGKFGRTVYIRNVYERFTCAGCNKSYKSKIYLRIHLRSHCPKTPRKFLHPFTPPYQCPYCDYRSRHVAMIKQHICCIHPDNILKWYNCAKCNKSYERKSSLQHHLKNECGRPAPKFGCPHCNKCFIRERNGLQHIQLEHPGKLIYVVHLVPIGGNF